ncbi:B-cell receptor CD22-like isoform X2 [Brachyhypopomus gauderio]|uniref:B-cell receptor CD22-like isoform X2 n=1 Tax=Brachyhypopomus gauderio TaxID=698409 RepID=UPI004041AD07
MMSVQITLVFLLIISGVVSQDGWSVNYNFNYVCALKGSTVIMGCSYQYPCGYAINKTFWSTELARNNVEPPDLSLDPEYRDRVQFLGDTQSICTLRLRNVTEQDQRQYYFRFLTTTDTGKHQDKPGVQLFITDLQVETPETVLEGEDVTLTCNTTCSLSQPKYTWYKNGVSLRTTTSLASNKHLILKTISKNDVNSYSCGVLGQSHRSSAVTLNVRYPPKNVSVSISPSGEIVENSSVILTCSSDANPPVQNYTWFKEGETSPVGSGQSYIFNDSGLYYCVVQNKYGTHRSTAVPVTLKGHSIISYAATGISLSGAITLLTAVIWISKRKRQNKTVAAVYESGHPSPPDDMYTALNPHTSSPDYNILSMARNQPSAVSMDATLM